jgi:outer membrane protein assembly factor BamB
VNRVTAILVLALFSLPGCSWIKSWGGDEPGDPAKLVKFESSLEVRKAWSTNVGDGMGKHGLSMAPVFSSGRLYTADYEGRLTVVDASNGRKVWEQKTKQAFSGGPGLEGGRIYMGTIDGRVIAYDQDSGAELWNAQVSSEVLAPPAAADGVVIVRCIDGRVFGLDEDNGRRIWIYDHSVPLLTLRGNADVLVHAGIAFIGYDDGTVVSLRVEDGSMLWNQTVISPEGRTELDRLSDIGGQMVIVASDLIVASYKNRLVSLAADSGRMLWFKEIASSSGVVVDRTRLALSDRHDDLWLLDRRNGSTFWKIDRLTNRGLTRPTFYGSYVVVGDMEGYLHWLDVELGAFVARTHVAKNGFAAAPLSVGTTLYVLTNNGDLVAYRAGAAI